MTKSNHGYVTKCYTRDQALLDSGASTDFVGADSLTDEEKSHVYDGDTLNIKTANGRTSSSKVINGYLPHLGIKVKPHVLENCPDVLSMGKRCAEEGFGFYWDPFSVKPVLVRPDGKVIACSYGKWGAHGACLYRRNR